MLILARNLEQAVHLHTNQGLIIVKVTSVDRETGKVRLGFEAPDSIDIIRTEIDVLDPIPA